MAAPLGRFLDLPEGTIRDPGEGSIIGVKVVMGGSKAGKIALCSIRLDLFVHEVAKRFFASKQTDDAQMHPSMKGLDHVVITAIKDHLDAVTDSNEAIDEYRTLTLAQKETWIEKVAITYCKVLLDRAKDGS